MKIGFDQVRLDLLGKWDWFALAFTHPRAYWFMRQRALRAELRAFLDARLLTAEEHARMQKLSLRFPDERSDNWRWKEAES